MNRVMRGLALAAVTMSTCMVVHAQESRAQLGGKVLDPSGAAIPKASVTVLCAETGVAVTTTTNGAGEWLVKALLPDHYTFEVAASGFKSAAHDVVELQVGDQKTFDVKMQVGGASELVNVSSESPLIDTTAAVSGTVLTTKELEDLPTQSHVPTLYASLVPGGIIGNGYGGAPHLWSNIGDSQVQVNGSGSVAGSGAQNSNYAVQYRLDGAYDSNVSGQVAFVPPQDSVAEFRVTANAYDASIGRQSGATLDIVSKSGTKDFHGSLYEYNQNNSLNAHPWGQLATVPVPSVHYNEYGATLGGPVWIPKIYDGRKRGTFFFFSYDGIRNNAPVNTGTMSLPTMLERSGDFSQSCQVNGTVVYQGGPNAPCLAILQAKNPGKTYTTAPLVIYDPLSIDSTTGNRQPFSGNKVPTGRISPFASGIFALIPPPDNAGDGSTSDSNNFQKRELQRDIFGSYAIRLDHAWNNANHSYANISFNNWSEGSYNPFGGFAADVLNDIIQARRQQTFTIAHTTVLSPKLLVDLKYSILNSFGASYDPSRSYDDTKLGLSSNFISEMPLYSGIPLLSGVVGGAENGGLGTNQANSYNVDTFQTIDAAFTQTYRNHTLKYGFEHMIQQQGTGALYQTSGQFAFGGNKWSCHNPVGDCSTGIGNGWNQVGFLLGMPLTSDSSLTSKIYQANTGFWSQHYTAAFVQDDWRATPKLTINLGMRWDYQTGVSERHNKALTRYNPSYIQNGVNSTSQPSYASTVGSPSSNIGVQLLQTYRPNATSLNAQGAVAYAGVNGTPRTLYDPIYHYFQPRIGAAYRFTDKLVLRGGLGRFVQASFDKPSQTGFDSNTYYTATNDNYYTQANTLANPFPNGLVQPTGNSLGALSILGQTTGFTDPHYGRVYVDEASASIQQEAKKFLFELGGTYNRTHGLALSTPTNTIPVNAYLSAFGPQFDANGRPLDTLSGNTPVANPYKGAAGLTTSLATASTVNASQLLRPNPLVNNDVGETKSDGAATYYALLAKVERRYSNGFSLLQSFTWGRNFTQDAYIGNISLTRYIPRQIYNNDIRFHYVISPIYELPFGRGRKFLNHANFFTEQLVGGWEFTGIYNFQSGTPLTLPTNSSFYRGDASPDMNVKRGKNGTYFDTTAFVPYPNKNTPVSTIQAYPGWVHAPALPGYGWAPTSSSDSAKNGVYNDFTVRNTLYPQVFGDIRNPPVNTVTAGVRKNFNFTEMCRLQLRMDVTNLFNHPQFGNISTDPSSAYFGRLSGSATPTSAVNNPRLIELAGKIYF